MASSRSQLYIAGVCFLLLFAFQNSIIAQPENDSPCPTDPNPPLDLTTIGNHTGTTCEATFDFTNLDCNTFTDDASVWYTFTPEPADDGYEITLSEVGGAGAAEGPITIQVYSGTTNQGCTGFTELDVLATSCEDVAVNFSIPNNFAIDEIMYIKITTDEIESECGEFNIEVVGATCGDFADNCSDITVFQTLTPVTLNGFELNYECIMGCLTYANPDLSATDGCEEFTENPTVWYKIEEDGEGAQLYTSVFTNGNWQPVWAIWAGDDCGNLTLMESEGNTCSNDDLTPDLYQIALNPLYDTYWVAVTYDPNSLPVTGIDDGTFEICASTVVNGIVCLGTLEGDCAEPDLVFEVIEREVEGASLDGPFCPGEEVTISMSFFYDASETSSDWLSGFIPKFGPGWDIPNWNPETNKPFANGIEGDWHEEGGDCAALIQEDVPHLCTYVNQYGKLELCNNLCESCEDCPTQGMQEQDPLPSGYFWVTNGGNAGCENDCTPGEGWGVGSTTAQVEWEFTIRVKDFLTYEDCFISNDLQISLQTFSQGVVGCWEDPLGECLIDKSQFSPLWKVDCNFPAKVVAEDQEICYNATTDILVETEDGSTPTIIVEVEDNPIVIGEMNHEFPGGAGIIMDDLLNPTNDIQTVIYHVYAEDAALTCVGDITTVEVTVYSQININFPPNHIVCLGECITLTPEVWGGYPGSYSYSWITGQNTPTIEVCPDESASYFLTVEDGLGCTETYEVYVEVKPAIEAIVPDNITVCKDGDFDPFDPEYIVCVDILDGNPPYEVQWNAPAGLVGAPINDNLCFAIDEESTTEFAGILPLGVLITDEFNCALETTIEVEVIGEFTVNVDVQDMECGDTTATIDVNGFISTNEPLTSFFLYGGCPENETGDFLDELFTSTGSGTFPPQNLNDYSCFQVVAQSESGCMSSAEIEIPIVSGTEISINGPTHICPGDEVTLTIINHEEFTNVVWTPLPWATGSWSIAFGLDTTTTFIVEATDASGCQSELEFTIIVNDENSEFCNDPCENQTADFQITGTAFTDKNANGYQDIGELPLSNVLITDIASSFSVFTNEFGVYAIPVDSGSVDLTASISQGMWVESEISKNVIVEFPCTRYINFGFVPDEVSMADGNVSASNTITRCDWESKFYITVENLDHDPFNGRVEFTFDEETTFFSSDIPGIQVANHKAIFETGLLDGFTPTTFIIVLKMPGGSANLPELDFKIEFFDGDNLLDTYFYTQQLRCSYDPNDKRTFPDRPGDENQTLQEERIEYTMRFQNNGNDTAFHVRLVDVLDPSIVPSTVRFINASHPYEACLMGDTLIVDFPNINLVDSTTNYDASQGFVSFSCSIDPNVAFGEEIFNTVDIIFDTNPPIVTNTTLNTIVEFLCTDVSTDVEQTICDGDAYMGYTEPGTYQIDLTTELGCDSIINLSLFVIEPVTATSGPFTICDGNELTFEGTTYEFDSSGTYIFEIEGPSGCIETLLTIDITLVESQDVYETFSICNGDPLTFEGTTYEFDSSGLYTYEIMGPSGCIETYLTLDISIVESQDIFEEFTLCEGDILSYEGETYEFETSGVYDFELLDENGCVIKNLQFQIMIISPIISIHPYILCEGAVITFEGQTYTFDSSGTYTYFEEGPSGCVEIQREFHITIHPNMYTQIDTTICEGQEYEGFDESGQYEVVLTDPFTGCPIFHTIDLTVLPMSDPDCLTNIEEAAFKDVKVYPIPSIDLLFIESPVQMNKITLFSSTGSVLRNWNDTDTNDLKLDVSDLPSGFHLIMIETNVGRVMKKVIITN